jgi:hypothetical protein
MSAVSSGKAQYSVPAKSMIGSTLAYITSLACWTSASQLFMDRAVVAD